MLSDEAPPVVRELVDWAAAHGWAVDPYGDGWDIVYTMYRAPHGARYCGWGDGPYALDPERADHRRILDAMAAHRQATEDAR